MSSLDASHHAVEERSIAGQGSVCGTDERRVATRRRLRVFIRSIRELHPRILRRYSGPSELAGDWFVGADDALVIPTDSIIAVALRAPVKA